MPLPAESLRPDSPDDAIQDAISKSVEQCMREGGRSQEECVGMAHSMARKATRRNLGRESTRKIRSGMGQ